MKHWFKYFLIVFVITAILHSKAAFSQVRSYRFEQIDSLQKVEKKPVIVFIHTTWCRYCAAMKHSSFKDIRIIELLNKNYYFIDFDAESKKTILFNNTLFNYKPTGDNTGINQLAIALGTIDGTLSYPTLCILNSDYEITNQFKQYLKPTELLTILKL